MGREGSERGERGVVCSRPQLDTNKGRKKAINNNKVIVVMVNEEEEEANEKEEKRKRGKGG